MRPCWSMFVAYGIHVCCSLRSGMLVLVPGISQFSFLTWFLLFLARLFKARMGLDRCKMGLCQELYTHEAAVARTLFAGPSPLSVTFPRCRVGCEYWGCRLTVSPPALTNVEPTLGLTSMSLPGLRANVTKQGQRSALRQSNKATQISPSL